jgi:hypothetical protein
MFIVVHFIFMMFTSKFKFYTKTKPIRIPEELTDSIMKLLMTIDDYAHDNPESKSPEKIINEFNSFIKNKYQR